MLEDLNHFVFEHQTPSLELNFKKHNFLKYINTFQQSCIKLIKSDSEHFYIVTNYFYFK